MALSLRSANSATSLIIEEKALALQSGTIALCNAYKLNMVGREVHISQGDHTPVRRMKYASLEDWKTADPIAHKIASKRWLIRKICALNGWDFPKPIGKWTFEMCLNNALQYSTKPDWRKNEPNAYATAYRKNWIEKCTAHMVQLQKPSGYWTKERCVESAKSYAVRSKWQRENYAAYDAARKNGWLNECCAHMSYINRPSSFYTLQNCHESAKKYKTRREWETSEDRKFYKAARTNGWMDACCGHMVSPQATRGYWTKKRCMESAKTFDTRTKWQRGATSAYAIALRKGWLDECCAHMTSVQKPHGYWNKDRCMESASHFTAIKDWQKENATAYQAAMKKGWLSDCTQHMELLKKPNGYWTLEMCMSIAKKYSAVKDWIANESASYNYANKKKWLSRCTVHMTLPTRYSKEACIIAAKKYESRHDWITGPDAGTYRTARKNNWLEECCAHMKPRAFSPKVWTKEKCMEDAQPHRTRSEWQRANGSAYQAASVRGWLEECCAHMTLIKRPNGYWTKERCIETAKLFKTKAEWVKAYSGACNVAKRNGWYDECCAHMVNGKVQWPKELCMEIAKKYTKKNDWRQGPDRFSFKAASANGWINDCCKHMNNN